jgi:hypothetical protein
MRRVGSTEFSPATSSFKNPYAVLHASSRRNAYSQLLMEPSLLRHLEPRKWLLGMHHSSTADKFSTFDNPTMTQ